MSVPGIYFDSVWKKFRRGEMHDSLRDLIPAAIRRLTGRSGPNDNLRDGDFWAVRDLSFEVHPGQTLGIIGGNGAGKSTTLKLLTRIYQATRGHCEIRGRVGALIEISAGFHGDLTGRENIYLQGAIMGMRTRDIRRQFDQIVEFSGISEFIETPVKRYSSGMNARLGFAIAAHLEPEVLIIDEVLSVGDMRFQERAYGRIRDLARSGIPVVLVSHQLDRISELCTGAILLQQGEVAARGTAVDVIAAYVAQNQAQRNFVESGLVEIAALQLPNEGEVQSGEHISLRIQGRITDALPNDVEPVMIRLRSLRTGYIIYMSSSRQLGISLPHSSLFDLQLNLQCNLPPGNYILEIVAHNMLTMQDLSAASKVMLQVQDTTAFKGQVQLNASIDVAETAALS